MCLNSKNETVFLNGLKKIKSKGVMILVDGSDDENRWRDMLAVREDSFYYTFTYDDPETRSLAILEFTKVETSQTYLGKEES